MIKNIYCFSGKVPLFFSGFNKVKGKGKDDFFDDSREYSYIWIGNLGNKQEK